VRFPSRGKTTAETLSICFVSQEYPEETGWGGIGTYTYEMAHALARGGHKVVVVSRALSQPQHYVEADGVEVYRILPSLNVNSTPVVWRLNRWWEGYRLAVAIQLRQILRERQIDIIESPELHAEPLFHSLLYSQPPLIVRLHSGSQVVAKFEPNHANGTRLNTRLERWLLGKAAHVTSPSKALLTLATEASDSKRRTVIPNPVDTDHFKPDFQTHESNSSANVLCVGRPRFLKGFHVLAQAIPRIWEENPETTFTFVPAPMGRSGGSPRDAYGSSLGNLIDDPRVQIVDAVPRERMPEFYRSATVCVVPSLWEGFGYVCVEAMACGKAVVASRTGGLEEIVEDGRSGILVEPGNAEELARAILTLIGDREHRTEIGRAARKRVVEEYSSATVAARMTNLYLQVIQHA
jgi:glycosyltransferase involved in cell wall biosynthesis